MKKYFILLTLFSLVLLVSSCKKEEYSIPVLPSDLQNDCIKHSLGPIVAGTDIVFAYAMALKPEEGKLVSAQVEATIAGAAGTYLAHQSLHTNASGVNIGVTVGDPSVTTGQTTVVTFNVDTCAATLRYYYRVPDEAKGKKISFKFSARASNGQTVFINMGPYQVRNMDMKLDMLAISDSRCFLSIADMAVYDAAEAAANPDKIDLVYLFRSIPGITFNHSLVSPSADPEYIRDVVLPSGLTNVTKIFKAWNVQDQQLARLQFGVFVDDEDFKKMDFTGASDFAINVKAEAGIWAETSDGKYRAYIFINKIDNVNKQITLSVKRLQMK